MFRLFESFSKRFIVVIIRLISRRHHRYAIVLKIVVIFIRFLDQAFDK